MTVQKPSSKMYLEIVNELRVLIKKENLKSGDKIPSERELSERLNVGRSTIREALRSLELLGLIETRRGEGTFLSDFSKHQLVEVLATFVLQGEKSFEDIHKTRQMHEKEAIRIVSQSEEMRKLPVWDGLRNKIMTESTILREDIIREIMIATHNRLSLKIWFLLKQYGGEPYADYSKIVENDLLTIMLNALKSGQTSIAINAYENWVGLLSKGGTPNDNN